MKISAIIFDFGGVLLKWNPYNMIRSYFSNDQVAMESFLNEIKFSEWNAQQDKGRSFSDGVEVLSKEFPHYAHIFPAFHENWEASLDGQFDQTIELLQSVKEKGYPLFGLSNWSAETFPIARAKYNFFDLFDGIILSGDVKLIKPDPAIFDLCLQMIQKPSQECLFIDDTETNIITAKKIGFDTIHFKSPGQLREELVTRKIL